MVLPICMMKLSSVGVEPSWDQGGSSRGELEGFKGTLEELEDGIKDSIRRWEFWLGYAGFAVWWCEMLDSGGDVWDDGRDSSRWELYSASLSIVLLKGTVQVSSVCHSLDSGFDSDSDCGACGANLSSQPLSTRNDLFDWFDPFETGNNGLDMLMEKGLKSRSDSQ